MSYESPQEMPPLSLVLMRQNFNMFFSLLTILKVQIKEEGFYQSLQEVAR